LEATLWSTKTPATCSCNYCLTGQSNLKAGHRQQLIFAPPVRDTYAPGSPLADRLEKVSDRLRQQFDLPLLKVTGGEVFLVKGMMDFLAREAERYEVLVVQTNGVLVTEEHLRQFRSWGNVVLQVSLDSHEWSGNSYRVQTASLHRKVLDRISAILDSGLPVEVYAVVHDRSAPELVSFARWLTTFATPPVFFRSPRGAPTPPASSSGRTRSPTSKSWSTPTRSSRWSCRPARTSTACCGSTGRAGVRSAATCPGWWCPASATAW